MARDTDRKKISEAIRLNSLWRIQTRGELVAVTSRDTRGSWVEVITDYDEALYVEYTPSERIRRVTYRHWDSGKPGFPIVTKQSPKQNKLAFVLRHLNQKDVNAA